MKFNEIRSGVLNKISGLESVEGSLARRVPFLPSFLPSRLSERTSAATKKVGWRRTGLGRRRRRSDYSNQSRDPTEQIEVAVIYDPGDGAGGSAAIFHPKITLVCAESPRGHQSINKWKVICRLPGPHFLPFLS